MRQKIEQTKAFSNLSSIQKKVYGGHKVMEDIKHHVVVAKNKGIEQWIQEFRPNKIIKDIVLEMLN